MEGVPLQTSAAPEAPADQEQALLRVTPLIDDVVEANGFGPRSMYVETCWLPLLGPSSTFLYRRLGSWAEHHPDGIDINLGYLAMSLGLGRGIGNSSRLVRSMDRLERFGVMRRHGAEVRVRRALPPLTELQARRLDPTTLKLHHAYVRRPKSTLRGRS